MSAERVLTMAELVRRWRRPKSEIDAAIERGEIKAFKVGRDWRVWPVEARRVDIQMRASAPTPARKTSQAGWGLAEQALASARTLPTCCAWMGEGHTYLVAGAGRIKIGQSTGLYERMVNLQNGSPVALRLVALARGVELEAVLHLYMASHRVHGEWFREGAVRRALGRILDAECFGCAWRMR